MGSKTDSVSSLTNIQGSLSLTLPNHKANKSHRFLERSIMIYILISPCLTPHKSILNERSPFRKFLLCPQSSLFLRDLFTVFQCIKRPAHGQDCVSLGLAMMHLVYPLVPCFCMRSYCLQKLVF